MPISGLGGPASGHLYRSYFLIELLQNAVHRGVLEEYLEASLSAKCIGTDFSCGMSYLCSASCSSC